MEYQSVRMTHVDGTMHHLGVNEKHVAKKVILTPSPLLIPLLATCMDDAVKMGDYREYVTFTGKYWGKPLTVMSCGFGCMPMAIAVEELRHLGCTEIIKIAPCAAIQEDIGVGTLLTAHGAVRGEGASAEYVDGSYPAVADMDLLGRILNTGKCDTGIFRSHDCLSNESPSAPHGMDRVNHWRELGVSVMDGETSSMFTIGGILGLKTASIALIEENYLTGKKLNAKDTEIGIKDAFRLAAEALLCC